MPSLRKLLSNIFWYPSSSNARIERYQKRIRDLEWNAIKSEIPVGSHFLDVGCGAGDNMLRAMNELDCTCEGIDPEPGSHGVGRYNGLTSDLQLSIQQGFAEQLPYDSNSFDVVFCSHVLEHVTSESKTLDEIKRVLKPDGTLIIGMPTATVAAITWISGMLFTTHISFYFALRSIGKQDFLKRLRRIILPDSHSSPRAKTVLYDLSHYRATKWKKMVSAVFSVEKTLFPAVYPMPDFPAWFPVFRLKWTGSSVFFVAKQQSSK